MEDFFGNIEKIQEEIETELCGELLPSSPPVETNFVLVHEEIAEPTFYRETIKNEPKKSWAAVAAVLFFVCTVGTGMLGIGMGAGWALFQRGGDSIISDTAGNNPEGISFVGTSYIFEAIVTDLEVATLSDMVELLAPSVVGITTYFNQSTTRYGSGIIFADSADRIFIATNLYIVRGGYRWDVSFEGHDPIPARPVGLDRRYDLAVAYVYKSQLIEAGIDTITFATFGDSDEMRIGDDVLAIGNALGEGTSVTRGIISATERPIFLPTRYAPLTVMQTDAAINYGSSGGPLINTRGEIIGININQASGMILGSTPVEGMGYSISSNLASPILERIVSEYRTPGIGITGICLEDDEYNRAEYWGIPPLGVIVGSVAQGRPADAAGIRPNDVITAFDGQPIFTMPQLQTAIRSREIGETIEIRILRNGTVALTTYVEIGVLIREDFNSPN